MVGYLTTLSLKKFFFYFASALTEERKQALELLENMLTESRNHETKPATRQIIHKLFHDVTKCFTVQQSGILYEYYKNVLFSHVICDLNNHWLCYISSGLGTF